MSLALPIDPAMEDPQGPARATGSVYFGRRGTPYRPDPRAIDAANAARTLGMPLLITGEPGCGKTDFAFAVARYLAETEHHRSWNPNDPDLLECYIRSETRAQDLLYRYDVVARFGDAYLRTDREAQRAKDARNYIQLEPLGMALVDPRDRVVLVDEIDKAPRDLPNDLLRELDQGWFEIEEIQGVDREAVEVPRDRRYGQPLHRQMGDRSRPLDRRPFVIITSNAERQLPDPFLRRCVFFHMEFPSQEQLRVVLEDHLRASNSPSSSARFEWVADAVAVFRGLRHSARGLIKKPSTSELLNWGSMIHTGGGRAQGVVRAVAEEISKRRAIHWARLPHLGCLVKLRADLEKLGVLNA